MHCTKLKTYMETGRVVFLPPSRIKPNPAQPRTVFSPEALRELSHSIAIHGILQPLSVRRMEDHYQLIAGERRYRAAQMAGLREIPCIVMQMDEQESGLAALLENLQRQDLNFVEEARAYSQLMHRFSLSQAQVAEAVGKSQSAVANTLRLLRHSGPVLEKLLEHGLTQRHGRALLKLPEEGQKLTAIAHIARNSLSVSQTESYIASLQKPSPGGRWLAEGKTDEGQQQSRPRNKPDSDTKPPDSLPHSSSVTFGDSARLRASPVGGSDSPPGCHSLPPTALRFPPGEAFLSSLQTLLQSTPTPITLTREDTPTHTVLTLHIPK